MRDGKGYRLCGVVRRKRIFPLLLGLVMVLGFAGEGAVPVVCASELPSAAPLSASGRTVPVGEVPVEEMAGEAAGAQSGAGALSTLPTVAASFQVDRFVLPEGARMLVVVEGTGGSDCLVYAYERPEAGGEDWLLRLCVPGRLGRGGMSNDRTEGDRTTPIGLFCLNTPFGQGKPLEGFPDNYVKVTKNHVWVTETNRLEPYSAKEGEHVGTKGYAGYYEYVLDAGYNRNAVEKKGAALFLHCQPKLRAGTSGCVEIPREQMIAIMRLYGAYGDGVCYIALAPKDTFSLVYDSYGSNNGLSPEGDFDLAGQNEAVSP